ncbi:MAG: hypothetical protein HY904_21430 [Deltaproteobacteria bacterium]|nr:hypothetical protein [Deltaproteobacteria bacterium]
MGLVAGLWLALLGVLGAASLIIAKKPDAKELIAKVAPYQGWIGAVSALWGVWGIINSILTMGTWLKVVPIFWATFLASSLLQFALGLLLGVGVLKTFIKQPQAVEKMDLMIAKLAPKQGMMGLVAIGVGIWMVISSFLWRVGG